VENYVLFSEGSCLSPHLQAACRSRSCRRPFPRGAVMRCAGPKSTLALTFSRKVGSNQTVMPSVLKPVDWLFIIICYLRARVTRCNHQTPSPSPWQFSISTAWRDAVGSRDKLANVFDFFWHDCPISNTTRRYHRIATPIQISPFTLVRQLIPTSPSPPRTITRGLFPCHPPVLLDPNTARQGMPKPAVTPKSW